MSSGRDDSYHAGAALCARLDWLVVVDGTSITHLHARV